RPSPRRNVPLLLGTDRTTERKNDTQGSGSASMTLTPLADKRRTGIALGVAGLIRPTSSHDHPGSGKKWLQVRDETTGQWLLQEFVAVDDRESVLRLLPGYTTGEIGYQLREVQADSDVGATNTAPGSWTYQATAFEAPWHLLQQDRFEARTVFGAGPAVPPPGLLARMRGSSWCGLMTSSPTSPVPVSRPGSPSPFFGMESSTPEVPGATHGEDDPAQMNCGGELEPISPTTPLSTNTLFREQHQFRGAESLSAFETTLRMYLTNWQS
ncbi:unnamed protein product, partial [Amoebophrya sp. A120]